MSTGQRYQTPPSAAATNNHSGAPARRSKIHRMSRSLRRRRSALRRPIRWMKPAVTPMRNSGRERRSASARPFPFTLELVFRLPSSDLHHFLLLRRDHLVDPLHSLVGLLLHLLHRLLRLVGGDVPVLLGLLEELLGVPALVANGELLLLALVLHLLHDLLAPVLRERGHRDPDQILVAHGV